MTNPSVTYTFSNSTASDAGQVNQNFTDLINAMTDGTKSFSIDALTCGGTVTINGAWSASSTPASNTAVGLVNTSAQSFAGAKTFYDGVIFDDAAGQSTLNYYKTGTIAPTLEASTSNPTNTYVANGQTGTYSRIGNIVFFRMYVAWSNSSGGSGGMIIADLPFTSLNSTNIYQTCSVWTDSINFYAGAFVSGFVLPNSTKVYLYSCIDAAGATAVPLSDNQGAATRQVVVQGWYICQ
jgi:hypothetical protein